MCTYYSSTAMPPMPCLIWATKLSRQAPQSELNAAATVRVISSCHVPADDKRTPRATSTATGPAKWQPIPEYESGPSQLNVWSGFDGISKGHILVIQFDGSLVIASEQRNVFKPATPWLGSPISVRPPLYFFFPSLLCRLGLLPLSLVVLTIIPKPWRAPVTRVQQSVPPKVCRQSHPKVLSLKHPSVHPHPRRSVAPVQLLSSQHAPLLWSLMCRTQQQYLFRFR